MINQLFFLFVLFPILIFSHPFVVINDVSVDEIWDVTRTTYASHEAFTGYVKVNSTTNANMFYMLFESQDGNQDAPLAIWLQGGPGCSSLLGV
ncbi:carboxypeptidase [Anaeramoeba flamelloides]|uniref:Carboxypeptidase n=1 Tax=Anaeramoeba flamelloides TaxID=1746091 RepID=A0ABQ8X110_9EUKA|nr:carboxypeptidase [Anaeramoeba flamelloides]